MIYLTLAFEFFKIGLFSIGGGMATIPFLRELAHRYDWFTTEQLVDMIAISESTPGPIGINMATYAGFQAGGALGGVVATLSLVFPSVIVIVLVSRFLLKFRQSRIVDGAFYGIRPASAGLIAGAMLSVLVGSIYTVGGGFSLPSVLIYLLFVLLFYLSEQKKPIHPLVFIAAGAVIGIVFGESL